MGVEVGVGAGQGASRRFSRRRLGGRRRVVGGQ